MRDTVIVAAGETAAEKAVSYLLKRIQKDVNLNWGMVGTQAMALLCDAEAARTQESAEAVSEKYSKLLVDGRPDILRARDVVRGPIADLLDKGAAGVPSAFLAALRELLDLI